MSGQGAKERSPVGVLLGGMIFGVTASFLRPGSPEFYAAAGMAAYAGLKYSLHLASVTAGAYTVYRSYNAQRIKGTAGWLSRREARRAGLAHFKDGIPLGLVDGMPVAGHTDTHTLVCGPAGSGKTINFVLPMLMHRDNAMLVSDPKGTLFEAAAPIRKSRFGQDQVLLRPSDRSGGQINPLDPISDMLAAGNPDALVLATNYAAQFHPEPVGGAKDPFWPVATQRLIRDLILIVCGVYGKDRATLSFCLEHLSSERLWFDTLIKAAETFEAKADADYRDALQAYVSGAGDDAAPESSAVSYDTHAKRVESEESERASRLRSDLLQRTLRLEKDSLGDGPVQKLFEQIAVGAKNAFEPFSVGSDLAWVTERTTVNFTDLKDPKAPKTIYIATSPNHQKAYAPWVGLLFTQAAFELVEVRNTVKVDFLLEEFNNAPIYQIPLILTLLREYGIRVTMVVQDLADISRVYGNEGLKTCQSEASIAAYLSVRSAETAEALSKQLGDAEVIAENFDGAVRRSMQIEGRPLMRPDEITRLDPGLAIVLIKTLKPLLVEKVSYAETRPWSKEAGTSAMHNHRRFERPWKLKLSYGLGGRISARGRSRLPQSVKKSLRIGARSPWKVRGEVASFFIKESGLGVVAAVLGIAVVLASHAGPASVLIGQDRGFCTYAGLSGREVVSGDFCPVVRFSRDGKD